MGLSVSKMMVWCQPIITNQALTPIRSNCLTFNQYINGRPSNYVPQISDVGIGLETSPDTEVYNNTVYTENYSNSIEYRFAATSGVKIYNNLTNQAIASRNGGSGDLQDNLTDAQAGWFLNTTAGDLHLAAPWAEVVDQGRTISTVTEDYDRDTRPQGPAYDIGADEFTHPSNTSILWVLLL